jgi:retron-type reverse transcriptase
VVPGRVEAALTKPGRASTARWCGSGERDGEEYERNRRCYVPLSVTGSNLADLGRKRCAPVMPLLVGGELPLVVLHGCRGGCGEGLRRTHSDAAGTESGSSFIERIGNEHGNRLGPCLVLRGVWGWAHRPPSGPRTGRSRRSTPSRGKLVHMGKGGSGIEENVEAVMPQETPSNGGVSSVPGPVGPRRRVAEMQAKLHRWAAADPGRRFDDLFNFAYDPATLIVAFDRVAGNTGARTAGVDGLTVAQVEQQIGVPGFLDDLRAGLKDGSFRPVRVRERIIAKPGGSGKVRALGIPTVADRVVQAALKLVLEPIFEADFEPVSYGFRPKRRAHDAVAEIHKFGTQGYRWVLDADIEACFDRIDHTALMDRVRARVKDKRMCALVKAFLKAGILTELGEHKDTGTGTPQGGSATRKVHVVSGSRWLEVG